MKSFGYKEHKLRLSVSVVIDLLKPHLAPGRSDAFYLKAARWVAGAAIMAMASKVTPIQRDTAPGASILGGLVKVTLKDGRTFEYDQPIPRGDHRNPPSDAELEEKFRGLVNGLMPASQAEAIIAGVATLEDMPDVSVLARLLALPGSPPR